jgi:hypothetical protein
MSAFTEFWGGMKESIEKDPVSAMVTGVGGAFAAGGGGGGLGGAAQGLLGGAMAGVSAGMLVTGAATLGAMGPVGWIIAGVLALIGGISGFMGGGSVTPETRGSMNFGTGRGRITGHRDQYVDPAIEQAWIQDRMEEWNIAFNGMMDILRTFGDAELFEMLGSLETFTFGGRGDLNMWATLFREEIIPDALRDVFEAAIGQGLGDLGVSDAKIQQLWRELDIMGTDRMLESLGKFVSAVIGMADTIESMDFDTMLDEVNVTSMEAFGIMIGNVLESIQMMTMGIDEMDILTQAETALEVQGLIGRVRSQEIQLLRQIQALSDQINASIDAQIESIALGGMEPGEQSQYFLDNIVAIMDQINAGTGSPEELQALMAQLLAYTSQYQTLMGENLYLAGDDGIIPADWLTDVLEEARGMANDQLEGFREEIRLQNEAIIAELQNIYDALSLTAYERYVIDLDVDIGITIDPGLQARIDARVDERLERIEGSHHVGRP